jgi:light-regulated signal transduction histidine kinase (bacteriophytochrome)
VAIRVDEEEMFYRFMVEDNGMGIDSAYHDKVFEIFQTLQSRDKVEGTGVGLAIIKKSVEDMGGQIRVESEETKGARFIFTWPKAA